MVFVDPIVYMVVGSTGRLSMAPHHKKSRGMYYIHLVTHCIHFWKAIFYFIGEAILGNDDLHDCGVYCAEHVGYDQDPPLTAHLQWTRYN